MIDLAAKSRRSTAEALTTITLALSGPHRKFPAPTSCAGHCSATRSTPPAPASPSPPRSPGHWTGPRRHLCRWQPWKSRTPSALSWAPAPGRWSASPPPRRPPAASGPCANALGYAVERRLLPANPLGQIQWKASEIAETVDCRSVANPAQAGRLMKAVRGQRPRGEHMEAFFGCLYYPALRPVEAVALREADCVLPARGWGRIDLAASQPRAGTEWTTTAPAARNAASSTARPARPAASPSRLSGPSRTLA
jgi:hypothetical protein